jgi:plasmid replication initiation protein
MQAQYVHKVHLTVKGSLVINRELVGCIVMAAKVQTSPNGRIVGGEVTATDEISAGTLGSPQAVPTAVTVLSGDAKHPAVIRATRTVHAATWVKVRHSAQNVMDDLPGSSFWEFEGELWRLGPAASAPQPKPGNTQRLVA